MPAKSLAPTAGITVADVDAKLPKGFFVRRGQVRDAFNLTEEDMGALVPAIFKPEYLPTNKRKKVKKSRAVFVRSQVMAIARKWENIS